jgi:acetolactate synthase-1/2/3 large subunit
MNPERHGGTAVAEVLGRHGVRFLFTLCGGHISPILIACHEQGIRVVDVRHEATAVFAADAVSRLSGVPGVAAVTAGPGLTNTVTAVKNAQMAQSPLIVLGGATATVLKGRGSLQDIDQFALMRPHVKWLARVRRVRDIAPAVERAFAEAQSGLPGPVFVELPIDLLYPRRLVAQFYDLKPAGDVRGIGAKLLNAYLAWHVRRLFAGASEAPPPARPVSVPEPDGAALRRAGRLLERAQRPLLLVGSQAVVRAGEIEAVRAAVERLGLPVYLSGMARGLLGRQHPLLLRHRRKAALRAADTVLLAGVPNDFRLNYGREIGAKTPLISINLSRDDLLKNRRPTLAILGDPGRGLQTLAAQAANGFARPDWIAERKAQDAEREAEIDAQAEPAGEGINPLRLLRRLDDTLAENSVLVGDGGDFVATASYTVKPRGPLRWLDPGVFGTLGAGAGFALGAKLARPDAEVWILYGDGSVGYTLSEWDTFVRHGVPVIGVVGNDAGWSQIAREQVQLFGTPLGTELRHTDYDQVAAGFGGAGLKLDQDERIGPVLREAKALAAQGQPVLVNAICRRTEFRKGSISM